ncbi:uncharacterized protein PHALS_04419 [Plasmopara halstedii]|uniref:Uncharacterized protein n=1 Tax=Plasmopara halstedii TaxID=4781 RepID=A0A0P1B1E1_PLAHL|nr:uncharacterized protein PHALS_04419 [Plasmopara halstedii]CEG47551.1 hypothetical protein PHALS_04419 [Plasmopara halstedii]|eukprot:XP_024583920.1 hypothetical protein PHALS_04419 [Plasmopara halstedii]
MNPSKSLLQLHSEVAECTHAAAFRCFTTLSSPTTTGQPERVHCNGALQFRASKLQKFHACESKQAHACLLPHARKFCSETCRNPVQSTVSVARGDNFRAVLESAHVTQRLRRCTTNHRGLSLLSVAIPKKGEQILFHRGHEAPVGLVVIMRDEATGAVTCQFR